MSSTHTSFFSQINDPADLRKIDIHDLKYVCAEIRDYLIDAVSKSGGHLGAGLGTVELAVALHYAFATPEDRIIWDVGHQAYPHKLLTGRKDRFHTLRKFKGISGFLKRSESVYDVVGAGHASTSISAALGIATARDFNDEHYKVVSVIGDGSMTGGMVYEAMNNCGILKKDLIVVLNDNNMSISTNVWAIANHFNELIASETYNRFRNNVWELAGHFDQLGDRFRRLAAKLEGGIKSVLTPGMLFEALGFRYFGPINGHNIVTLVHLFREVQQWSGPILVHVVTQKGKGYAPAENDGMNLHGVSPFDKITGKSPEPQNPLPSYTNVFGNAVLEIARQNRRVVAITAAMLSGTGVDIVQQEMPDRCFDVGIAEQHGVTFASGLAIEGFIPIVAVYSTFLQRAFDQIIHDVALQHLHVVFAIDRAGLVGADGPTHHGAFDLSYLRVIPEMVIMAPADGQELRDMLWTAVTDIHGPVAIRYPRGNALGIPIPAGFRSLPIGKGVVVREGSRVAILALGSMVESALQAADLLAADGSAPSVVNMRFIKPLDMDLLESMAATHDVIVTVEDNAVIGGLGSAVTEALAARRGTTVPSILRLGLPDAFVEHGTQQELFTSLGLDAAGIAHSIRRELSVITRQQSTTVEGARVHHG